MQTSSPAELVKGPTLVRRAARKLAADSASSSVSHSIGWGGTSERSTQTRSNRWCSHVNGWLSARRFGGKRVMGGGVIPWPRAPTPSRVQAFREVIRPPRRRSATRSRFDRITRARTSAASSQSCVSPSSYLRISPNQDPLGARVKRVISCGNISPGEQHNREGTPLTRFDVSTPARASRRPRTFARGASDGSV